jgi:Carboxypeptidase regulatory-like domain/TonB dependent receptor
MAQDITDAAIEGRIVSVDSTPVEHAIVHVVNTSNGERWQTTSRAQGRYFIEYLSVGGPYRIEVVAIGYQAARRDSIALTLGQRLTVNFRLTPTLFRLQEITVIGTGKPDLDAARNGPAQIISDSTIARLPVRRRDYTELALLSPQITRTPNGGLSFAGQHDRYNSIQIDGTGNLDPFGRRQSGNGTPGWAVGMTAFIPEAVKELQFISAPFDVRYGGFAGGLINAVTQSGSNQFQGSFLGHYASAGLLGGEATGIQESEFRRKELGLTVGGPIVRDRAAFFLSADWSAEVIPQGEPVPTSGDLYESLVRVQNRLRSEGVDPGSFSAGTFKSPAGNVLLKVTAQLGVGSRLAVVHNYGHGRVEDGVFLDRSSGTYPLSSRGSRDVETINSTRLNWTRAFSSGLSNKLFLSRVNDRRTCLPNSGFPAVSLRLGEGGIDAGIPPGCLGLETGHTSWEFKDHFGVVSGNHRLILGVQGERIDMVDNVVGVPGGEWSFDNLDDLEQGQASRYTRDLPIAADSQVKFRINQIGVYLQDQWLPTANLALTAGLRLDVPFVPTGPKRHPAATRDLRINTALTPGGNPLWSPRFGVNYDPSGRGTTVLRGGVGFFAGHPAYVWFRDVYGSTGAQVLTLKCVGGSVPNFTLDPGSQPEDCDEPTPRGTSLVFFDPEFRFPQTLKLALGTDLLLPAGIVGTLDFLYTRGINSMHMEDVNLVGPVATATGEAGRPIYGRIDSQTALAYPDRWSDSLGGVYQIHNGRGDRSYSFTVQLQKSLVNGTELSAAYTYTDAKDRMNMDANSGDDNTGSTPVNGALEHRELTTSFWERPHKVTLVATTDLPLGFRLGLTYIGMSGAPYTYVVLGDPNADGFTQGFGLSNDVVYVPRDAGDVTLVDEPGLYEALDSLILDEPCLRSQRGRLLERNSCRDPWVHETAARLSKGISLGGDRALEVAADLFNVLNFVDTDWGLVRQTSFDLGHRVGLLDFHGYDTANGRGVYAPVAADRRQIEPGGSRWRLELSATLSF